jgi:hypothetical protein
MRSSRLSKSSLIFAAGIANALALVGTVFGAIAAARGSRVVLSMWAIGFGVSMLVILGYMAVERDP